MDASSGSPPRPADARAAPRVLHVELVGAHRLSDADGFGGVDVKAYAEAAIIGADGAGPRGSLDPSWGHRIAWRLGGGERMLCFRVGDSDPLSLSRRSAGAQGRRDFLGYAELPLTPLLLQRALGSEQALDLHLGPRPGEAHDDDAAWLRRRGGG
eukprot:gene35731-18798_t